mgnify:CR=1 FL=1
MAEGLQGFLGAGTTPQQFPDPYTETETFGPLPFDPEALNYPQTQGQTVETAIAVSYTHLKLPTIYSV